jgi:hypothetical protein
MADTSSRLSIIKLSADEMPENRTTIRVVLSLGQKKIVEYAV